MSLLRLGTIFLKNCTSIENRVNYVCKLRAISFVRPLSLTAWWRDEESEDSQEKKKTIDPAKDRTRVIPVETSIKYLQSQAFKETYGGEPVWKYYRRNFKGQFPPPLTRKRCIRFGEISTGSPCPICRDEYLVLDYRNIELLKHFISPHTGEILSYKVTGICQYRYQELLVAMLKARDHGFMSYDVPVRQFDYSEFYDTKVYC